jgi:hypothetical protein
MENLFMAGYKTDSFYGYVGTKEEVESTIYGSSQGGEYKSDSIYGYAKGALLESFYGFTRAKIESSIYGVLEGSSSAEVSIHALIPLVAEGVVVESLNGNIYGFTGLTLPGSSVKIAGVYGYAGSIAQSASEQVYGHAKMNTHLTDSVYGIAEVSTYSVSEGIYGYTINYIDLNEQVYGVAFNDQENVVSVYGWTRAGFQLLTDEFWAYTRGYTNLR